MAIDPDSSPPPPQSSEQFEYLGGLGIDVSLRPSERSTRVEDIANQQADALRQYEERTGRLPFGFAEAVALLREQHSFERELAAVRRLLYMFNSKEEFSDFAIKAPPPVDSDALGSIQQGSGTWARIRESVTKEDWWQMFWTMASISKPEMYADDLEQALVKFKEAAKPLLDPYASADDGTSPSQLASKFYDDYPNLAKFQPGWLPARGSHQDTRRKSVRPTTSS